MMEQRSAKMLELEYMRSGSWSNVRKLKKGKGPPESVPRAVDCLWIGLPTLTM